ncbi:MAG: VTT domain-containing protein [Cyanobacteria bacterium P01_H01_bin.35]
MNEYFSNIIEVIEANGWWIVFVLVTLENIPIFGLVVPGVTVIILSGYLAGINNSTITTFYLFFSGIIGVVTGDNIAFLLGKFGKNKIKIIQQNIIANRNIIEIANREKWFILIWYQFPVYLRMLLPLIMGAINFSIKKWIFINIVGSIIFVSTFFIIGIFISKVGRELSRGMEISSYIQIFFFGIFLLWIVLMTIKIKKVITANNDRNKKSK